MDAYRERSIIQGEGIFLMRFEKWYDILYSEEVLYDFAEKYIRINLNGRLRATIK